ncbi:MAG: exopolyphosphatase [Gallionellaceae bacterium]|nr:MAG: exopolyphosphatase [Gallionellaceae bacterium]
MSVPQQQPILAAVDLGSNSFRLQVARVDNEQIYLLDGLREPVRLAAGLTENKLLDKESQQRALACLQRFGERLRGLPREAVRAVGTNSLRVAKNAPEFLPQAEAALGFPIEVIAGREEARLIYLGVAHGLPQSAGKRLVMDIGGGSTEFIIGSGLEPIKLESLYMGCVSYSLRYFPDGKTTKSNLKQAEIAARNELQTIVGDYRQTGWGIALGSSGSARVLCDILEQNGYSEAGITRDGLEQLRTELIRVGDIRRLELQGLKSDRVPVLPGGFAIMYAALNELGIEQMVPALGALREGVLYDLFGRFHNHDMRDVTVQQFMRRYHVDVRQAERVARLSGVLAQQFLEGHPNEEVLRLLEWASRLHEIGISVAHSGFHKHTAYILKNADMPGFSKKEQDRLSILALAQRGNLEKIRGQLFTTFTTEDISLVMALRLSTVFYRNRSDAPLPAMQGRFSGTKFHLALQAGWRAQNPLTDTALQEEAKQWREWGVTLQVVEG